MKKIVSSLFLNILEVNLLQNPSFEIAQSNFKPSLGAMFHVVESTSTIEGNFVGRLVIRTRSYLARTVTKNSFEQSIVDPNTLRKLIKKPDENIVSFSLYSKLESCFFSKDDFEWGAYLWIQFTDGSSMQLEHEFDTSNIQWQGALITACLSKWSKIKEIKVVAHLAAKSCASLWDGFVLV